AIYLFSPTRRKNINRYLIFLIFVLLIGLSGRVLYLSEIFGKNFRLIALSEFAIVLFGSTVYLFTKSSLTVKAPTRRDLLHYLPGIFYILTITFYYILPSNEVINSRVRSGELFLVVSWLTGIGLAVNITYWGLSVRQFLHFRKRLLDELSYSVKTQFFFNFLLAIGACLFVWSIIYLVSLWNVAFISREIRQAIWLGIAFIILFIAYYCLSEPELFRQKPLLAVRKYTQSKLSATDLDQLKGRLDQLMEDKKPYLNSKLLKAELANMLDISNPELARLLNERIGMNFFEYVNYFRIMEFIQLAKSDKAHNMTFFGLAQEAGFNSKTTFNKSFKKLMGRTPREYFAKQ
ncbi:MAG: helix-turn-helix domain-containing protein, partial [Bacteroidota bacterium]